MCPCVEVVGRTKQNKRSQRTLKYTPLIPSEEHVGRISKRTLDSPEGDIKEQQEHIISLLDRSLIPRVSVLLR